MDIGKSVNVSVRGLIEMSKTSLSDAAYESVRIFVTVSLMNLVRSSLYKFIYDSISLSVYEPVNRTVNNSINIT